MDKAFTLNANELGSVPLSLIDPDPDQPRKDFDKDWISQLAQSIKTDGVIQPIVLRNKPDEPGRFFIVAGENRYRASKEAKKRNIPAVLREVDGLSKLLIQIKENHQRRDLNPMEWAQAFQVMHKTHGLKQTDIEKTLKEAGVGNFGRAYIGNTIRLLSLPEWAQDLIRYNEDFTAAHGKHLLPAMDSEKVTEALHTLYNKGDWNPTTRDLQTKIYFLFSSNHDDLTGWQTKFDFHKKCVATGCQKMRKVSTLNGHSSTFCMDKKCHAQHQADHQREQKEQQEAREHNQQEDDDSPTKITADENNRVDLDQQGINFMDYDLIENADFDITACKGCKDCHIAVSDAGTDEAEEDEACFNAKCYNEKGDRAQRASKLLIQHMRARIAEHITAEPLLAYKLVAWAAACSPDGIRQHGDEEYISSAAMWLFDEDDEDLQTLLFKHRLFNVTSFLNTDDPGYMPALAELVVNSIGKTQALEIWRHFKISIDDYRIDEHYLAEHTEKELTDMLNVVERTGGPSAAVIIAESAGKLDTLALEWRDAIGVPAEIRFAFQQLTADKED